MRRLLNDTEQYILESGALGTCRHYLFLPRTKEQEHTIDFLKENGFVGFVMMTWTEHRDPVYLLERTDKGMAALKRLWNSARYKRAKQQWRDWLKSDELHELLRQGIPVWASTSNDSDEA